MTEQSWQALLTRKYDTPDQGFLTTWFSQRIGSAIAAFAYRLRLTPNQVTLAGLAVMLLACLPYVAGASWVHWGLAGVLWQVGFGFDCADGQLARATGQGSQLGAWLDVACDYVRQIAISLSLLAVFLQAEIPGFLSMAACFLLMAGSAVYQHTATFMSLTKPPDLESGGTAGVFRLAIRNVLDTPVFLLIIFLLRPTEWLLCWAAIFYGVLQLIRAMAISRKRLTEGL